MSSVDGNSSPTMAATLVYHSPMSHHIGMESDETDRPSTEPSIDFNKNHKPKYEKGKAGKEVIISCCKPNVEQVPVKPKKSFSMSDLERRNANFDSSPVDGNQISFPRAPEVFEGQQSSKDSNTSSNKQTSKETTGSNSGSNNNASPEVEQKESSNSDAKKIIDKDLLLRIVGNNRHERLKDASSSDDDTGSSKAKISYQQIKARRKNLIKIEKLTDFDKRSRRSMQIRSLSPPSSSDENNLYIGWIAYPVTSPPFRRNGRRKSRRQFLIKAARILCYPVTKVCQTCSKIRSGGTGGTVSSVNDR